MKLIASLVCCFIFFMLPMHAEYSRFSLFGGLNFIYNSDSDQLTDIPGMKSDGNPGGLTSAPSPLTTFAGLEYRLLLKKTVSFAPSISLYTVQYLWANDRALPAEIENRTAFVMSAFLDMPFLYHLPKNNFIFSFGGGPAILARYSILELGISPEAKNPGESLNAAEQVKAINTYFLSDARWLYPTVQASMRYKLQTGWGAGLNLRVGIPISNLWAKPTVTFVDSIMILASVSITPPLRVQQNVSEPSVEDTVQTPVTP